MGAADLTGQQFHDLLVLGLTDKKDKFQRRFWRCLCSCGKECLVCTSHLRSGNTKSCGHRHYRPNQIYLVQDGETQVGVCLVDDGRDYFWFSAEDLEFIAKHQWHFAGHYVKAIVQGKHLLLSRCLLGIINEDPTTVIADHINGDSRDNRRSNLRITNPHGNVMNRGFSTGYNETPSGKFQARLHKNKKFINCGLYDTPQEASQAYIAEQLQHFGEYAPCERVLYYPGHDNDNVLNPKNLLPWVDVLQTYAEVV